MKSFQQVAAVDLQRVLRLSLIQHRFKRRGVTPERIPIEADLFIAPADHHGIRHRTADQVKRLPQRPTGMLLVELGPEESEKDVSAVETAGDRHGKISKQREPFRRREDRPNLSPL